MNYCSNCGAKVNNGDSFCKECGAKILLVDNKLDNDDGLIDAYIGKNSDKIRKEKFSIYSFIFGVAYFIYRKVWILVFAQLIIIILSGAFFGSYFQAINGLVNILLAFNFRKIYLNYVKKKVDSIKLKNSDKSMEEIKDICSKKGGTILKTETDLKGGNILKNVVTLIGIAIGVILFVFISIFAILVLDKDKFEKVKSDYIISETEEIGDLTLNVPKPLSVKKINSEDQKFYHTKSNDKVQCSLNLRTRSAKYYNNDVKKYLESDIYYSNKDIYSGIEQKMLNNNSWYYAVITSDYSKKYYYATINKELIYLLQFNIYSDEQGECSSAYNKVINSLNFEE